MTVEKTKNEMKITKAHHTHPTPDTQKIKKFRTLASYDELE